MPETILIVCEEKMEKTLESLKKEVSMIRTGRANPAVLNGVSVNYYGVDTPLNQISSISVPEAQTLMIKPYDKGILKDIEKAIQLADLNLTPQNDGTVIRINFPALTEARRKEFVKELKGYGENAKVAVRNIRRDANDVFKKQNKANEISDDEAKQLEAEIQKLTDKYIAEIDETMDSKSKEIMTV